MIGPDSTSSRVYFPELDGLRFVAFLLVFGFHGGLPWVPEFVSLATLPIFAASLLLGPEVSGRVADLGPAIGRSLVSNGWVGVQLFFILSGYLIATLLLREEARFGRVDLRAFWVRRALRIWPLYYATVAVTFFLMPAIDGRLGGPANRALVGRHLPWFLAFLGNWSMIRSGAVGDDAVSILWSVCVEEQFYLACPLLVALVGRGWRVPIVLIGMAGAVGYRGWLASSGPEQLVIQYNALAQLDTMLSGVLLALVLDRWTWPILTPTPHPTLPRKGGGDEWNPPPLRGRVGWGVGSTALRRATPGWAVLIASVFLLTRPELAHLRPARQTWDFVALWLVGMGVVASCILGDGRARRVLASRWLVYLGRISYGLYMYHEVGLWAARKAAGALPRPWISPTIPALALTIGLASASYYGLERPFLRLKKGWTRVPSRPI